jgi:hypothetical protein
MRGVHRMLTRCVRSSRTHPHLANHVLKAPVLEVAQLEPDTDEETE